MLVDFTFEHIWWLKKRLMLLWSRFCPSTLVSSRFPPKIQFLYCLLSPHGEHQRKNVLNLGLQIAGKCISDTLSDYRSIVCTSFFCNGSNFSWNVKVLWAVSKKNWLERCIQLSFICVCKYLNQNIRRIGTQNGKSIKKNTHMFSTKKQTHMKTLSFITQCKIGFLLLFTSCRKVFGKMPAWWLYRVIKCQCQRFHASKC